MGDDAKRKLESGIEIVSKAVKSTLGPRGRTVIIESQNHSGGLTVTKDGVTVARSIHLEDSTEDLAVRLLRESATRTAHQAGDGTTTSIVLAEAILNQSKGPLSRKDANIAEISREIHKLGDVVVNALDEVSIKVKDEDLMRVATISANNDEDLGKVISDAYLGAGEDGVVQVDQSPNHKTYFEVTEGIQFKRGWTSPHQVTNPRVQSCDLDNPLILINSVELPSMNSIEQLLMAIVQSGRPLLIIGKLSHESMMSLNHNVHKGLIKACHVIPPGFGDQSRELMSDMAIAFGGKHIDEAQGDNWEQVTFADLGTAKRVVVTRELTSISRDDKVELSEEVETLVEDLRSQLSKEEDDREAESLKERIAGLCGHVATVYVGADTDIERKEKKDRADDAVLATKAAIEDGILSGGGVALRDIADVISNNSTLPGSSAEISKSILSRAMREPCSQIMRNSEKTEKQIQEMNESAKIGFGYDAKNDKIVNMIEAGIIDPAKVTKSSLKNAISVAATIMNTSAIITDAK